MKDSIKLARRIFLIAGIYGLVVTLPMYFSEHPSGIDYPPDITHPEWYYGFAGVVVAWAILFLFLSRGSHSLSPADDPLHNRKIFISARSDRFAHARPYSGFVSPACRNRFPVRRSIRRGLHENQAVTQSPNN